MATDKPSVLLFLADDASTSQLGSCTILSGSRLGEFPRSV